MRMVGRRPRRYLLALVVPAMLAAGCGDDADDAEPPEAAAAPAGVVAQYATVEQEIAAEGGQVESGPWRVAYIVEPAEPWHEPDAATFRFREPAAGETHHIEIIPFEKATGRIVPDVPITVDVVDSAGTVVETKQLNFYYAEFFHYANNFSIPKAGEYTLRAKLAPPRFFRHGEATAPPALGDGATVEFSGVTLAPEA